MYDIIKRIALEKYGNGEFYIATIWRNDRLRVELWNAEKTKLLFVFDGEI